MSSVRRLVLICVILVVGAPRSPLAEVTYGQFVLPPDLKIELFADETQLADPVAICLDEQGRLYVAETGRAQRGVEENRRGDEWLDDDLASQTVADRRRMIQKWAPTFPGGLDYFTKYSEQLRLLEDTDNDGRADHSTIFASGFNDVVDGLAAGVIARQGEIYFACIPNLYRLRDRDRDGQADEREVIHHGFGVRHAFYGHDLHGLVWGPDGKLYFSMGDRGFHVETPQGHTLHSPDRGAVLRCNPDGSDLEVFASGLRNPQELAFDAFGNLFTGDNNSDAGDKARLVYLPEGSDSGWRMEYQYMNDPYPRGPWSSEKLWHPQHTGQPAWILPPIAWITDGPSGMVYYPGVGLPERYQGHFFLCDFRGDATSQVVSFAVRPIGAGFEMVDARPFLQKMTVTDVDFGYDGKMYVADFITGWDVKGAGKIHTVHAPEHVNDSVTGQVQELFREGFVHREIGELVALFSHPDMRVRLQAQFTVAEHGPAATEAVQMIAGQGTQQLARLHAIWCLGQIGEQDTNVVGRLLPLLSDADAEIRAQTAKVLGENSSLLAAPHLVELLGDESLRVRAFAAQALGKLGDRNAVDSILEMLEQNADEDVFLRHGGVMGLTGIGDAENLLEHADHPSRSVRLAVLLALRRMKDSRLGRFLDDPDPLLVAEAARAIHDLPLPAAMPKLAALIEPSVPSRFPDQPDVQWSLVRRVLNANFRLGQPQHAMALSLFAANPIHALPFRSESLDHLLNWTRPPARDAVLGHLQDLPPRDPNQLAEVLQPSFSRLLNDTQAEVFTRTTQLATSLGIEVDNDAFFQWLRDDEQPIETRIAALNLLAERVGPLRDSCVEIALGDDHPVLRAAGRDIVAKTDATGALELFAQTLGFGTTLEQQRALATLASMELPGADQLIESQFDQLLKKKLAPPLHLDVLEAARERRTKSLQQRLAEYEEAVTPDDPLTQYQWALEGGDCDRGRAVFFNNTSVQCQRCHAAEGRRAGDVGPDLSDIGAKKDRKYLLESIVEPNRTLAEGYRYSSIITEDGIMYAGRVLQESANEIRLQVEPQGEVSILVESIVERAPGISSMPNRLVERLEPNELRDLIEFLAQQKKTPASPPGPNDSPE